MTAGRGDRADGILKVESTMLKLAATCGKAVAWDVMELVSDVVPKGVLESMADVMT